MKSKSSLYLLYGLMVALILIGAAVFLLPLYLWSSMEETPLEVWIVDKTVDDGNYKEHKGFMWALNSLKVISKDTGETFKYDRDYYGVHPNADGTFHIEDIPGTTTSTAIYAAPDLIYLTDTYGVYEEDTITDSDWVAVPPRLYGGLTQEEITHIGCNLFGGNTIIGEYDIVNSSSVEVLENIFSVSWLGYRGKYFDELSKIGDIPLRIVESYELQTGTEWKFEGPGMILISAGDVITVLQEGLEFEGDGLKFDFADVYRKEFSGEKGAYFDAWFEFTEASPTVEILANYSLELTEKGQELFAQLGLPSEFPAMIRWANAQYTSYYFAGDCAERSFDDEYPENYGYSKIRRWFSFSSEGDNASFYQNAYLPVMEKVIDDIRKVKTEKSVQTEKEPLQLFARTQGKGFQRMNEGQWEDFFIKGVNIGSSLPGKWFTEFSKDEALYLQWFRQIADMNANTIRAYTLLAPDFYSALAYFNKSNPQSPLWLYQEIWPEENPENGNYLVQAYDDEYKKEIKNVINAMHGQAKIPQRSFRAYGIYAADVSPYIAGYLVGRELEPEEVIQTNLLNPGYAFEGDYFFSESDAAPTEAWLAMSCDYVAQYETEAFGWQHPIGIVSWPTLDPTEHDSEWNISGDKNLEYNDKTEVDINHIGIKENLKAGFFGAYHISPNYPDFMNNEVSYALYTDEEGVLRYGGYLQEFIENHTKYPALVAEFGLSTGMGNAHENPDGYNHGGLNEEQQGLGIVRMMKAIEREGYAGGLIFEWADEWAKKTWITEPYILPFERNPLWHNIVDPEQNYGIVAMEASGLQSEPYTMTGGGTLQQVQLAANEAYLSIQIDLGRAMDFDTEDLIVGLDTYARDRGEKKYSPEIAAQAPTGMEFIVKISDVENVSLLVHPSYNITKGKQSSVLSNDGYFERMVILINKERPRKDGTKIAAIYHDQSEMKYGSLEDNSFYSWTSKGNTLYIRIPWARLNFSDPSRMRVLEDSKIIPVPLKDELGTTISGGIVVSALLFNEEDGKVVSRIGTEYPSESAVFRWKTWDVPAYTQRAKSSYSIIRDYFDTIGQ